MMRYAYFPGCSAKGSCSELDDSIQKVAAEFGIEILELKDAGCTGAREFRASNPEIHLAMNARILALAEEQTLDLMVV